MNKRLHEVGHVTKNNLQLKGYIFHRITAHAYSVAQDQTRRMENRPLKNVRDSHLVSCPPISELETGKTGKM